MHPDANTKIHLVFVLGTRPEAIKLAPVILAARARAALFYCTVVNTGQHRNMSITALAAFGIKPDADLETMNANQTPTEVLARILNRLPAVLAETSPHLLLVQGDTSTALGAALCAHNLKIPVAHVEAGLRTGKRYSPFPEEMNRRLISELASYHFAPTKRAREHLLHEGIPDCSIVVTGNPVVDALYYLRDAVSPPTQWPTQGIPGRMLLLTCHRRENHGTGIRSICTALRDIIVQCPEVHAVVPVHPNPNVSGDVFELLRDHPRILLIPSVDYPQLVWLLQKATLVLTDSGGIQEEAPAFGKPVLVLRDVTERPEGIEAGVARLVGTDRQSIVEATLELLENDDAYASMSKAINPYGDGHAAQRILQFVSEQVHLRGRMLVASGGTIS
jgi:UDP-N-acetylglucosamine 2-epimerase (non-hydrolysing)